MAWRPSQPPPHPPHPPPTPTPTPIMSHHVYFYFWLPCYIMNEATRNVIVCKLLPSSFTMPALNALSWSCVDKFLHGIVIGSRLQDRRWTHLAVSSPLNFLTPPLLPFLLLQVCCQSTLLPPLPPPPQTFSHPPLHVHVQPTLTALTQNYLTLPNTESAGVHLDSQLTCPMPKYFDQISTSAFIFYIV